LSFTIEHGLSLLILCKLNNNKTISIYLLEICVPFLQAVFCLKGFDDRNRFFATSIIALFGFVFLSAIFSGYLVISFAILLLLTVALTCSTKRRLHDAKLNKNWQLVPSGLFFLTGVLSLVIDSSSSYYLLILPALSTALLLTYPSKNESNLEKGKYIWGYYGPVDLSSYQQEPMVTKAQNQRIEPTLAANAAINEQAYITETPTEQVTIPNSPPSTKQADIGELIRLKFLSNRKLQLGVIASVSLIFIAVFINSLVTSFSQQQIVTEKELIDQKELLDVSPTAIQHSREHLIAMPDNFNLYLSAHQGITMHWQADLVDNGELWSLLTAKGDKSCQSMTFNKGSSLRPFLVLVENGSDYFASFSPLDSKELVQALAFRGKFSLCGYSFSLKGTQAVLGKHTSYAPFLDKDA